MKASADFRTLGRRCDSAGGVSEADRQHVRPAPRRARAATAAPPACSSRAARSGVCRAASATSVGLRRPNASCDERRFVGSRQSTDPCVELVEAESGRRLQAAGARIVLEQQRADAAGGVERRAGAGAAGGRSASCSVRQQRRQRRRGGAGAGDGLGRVVAEFVSFRDIGLRGRVGETAILLRSIAGANSPTQRRRSESITSTK